MYNPIPSSDIGRWRNAPQDPKNSYSPYSSRPLAKNLGSGLTIPAPCTASSSHPRLLPTLPLSPQNDNTAYERSSHPTILVAPTPSPPAREDRLPLDENDSIVKCPLKRRVRASSKDTGPSKVPRIVTPSRDPCKLTSSSLGTKEESSLNLDHHPSAQLPRSSGVESTSRNADKPVRETTSHRTRLSIQLANIEYELSHIMDTVFPNTDETFTSTCYSCKSLLLKCTGRDCAGCKSRQELCIPCPRQLDQCTLSEQSQINEYIRLCQLCFKLDQQESKRKSV
ncbi:hypothetical protein I204_05218 [Kwoniella mangroviensis CBS 8886]|uniref:uncharacterized protein n=1 Tax=Kwoniella mangroviensis CBS 8507 TaxID=1296122 RepID=UPI00080CD16B|nr:hypothetical protein I204_05218 [Kwoniella mangroviensis CBS 8886]